MASGFIKLYRDILDWEWYRDPCVCRLFVHLLLTANFEDARWRGIEVKRGQHVTSLASLSKETGLSLQQIRTALRKLKSSGEIGIRTTSRYSIVTVVKYGDYQGASSAAHMHARTPPTGNRQAGNTPPTTNKEEQERDEGQEGKERRVFRAPSLEEVSSYCHERGNGINPQMFIDYYETNGWMRGKTKIRDWKACVRTWEQRDAERTPPPEAPDPYAHINNTI